MTDTYENLILQKQALKRLRKKIDSEYHAQVNIIESDLETIQVCLEKLCDHTWSEVLTIWKNGPIWLWCKKCENFKERKK